MMFNGYRKSALAAVVLVVLVVILLVSILIKESSIMGVDSPVMSIPINVSTVGEKFNRPIEFKVSGNYLFRPKIDHSSSTKVIDSIPSGQTLMEMGKNTNLEFSLLCKGSNIPLKTQKIHTGVLLGFNVPNDVPLGTCEMLSISVTKADIRFSETPNLLIVELIRLAK